MQCTACSVIMAQGQQWWILLELLCSFLLQVAANTDDTRIETLVTIKQRDDGVELSVFPKYFGIKSPASEPTLTKLVSGQQLSSDCGDQNFRCKPLPIATQNTSNNTAYQIFVPLHGGLLITELKLSANKSNIIFGSHQILETRDCSPTAIFELYDSHYTMCTNLQNKLVSLYEIRVNKTSIEQTEMRPIVAVEQLADASDVVNMSNFLVSTDIPHQPLIYFAVDNYLFAVDPLDYSVYFDFIQIGTTRCRHIHRLARVSSSQILAYCSSEFVYFDIEQEDWVSEHSYTESGVPYICPNEMYGVKAFQNYIEYSIGQRTGTLSHVNVDSGVCFSGSGGQNFFVYNDKVADTTALMNITLDRQAQMQLCKNLDCLPIIAVEDPVRYLIIRQPSGDGRVSVLDIEANFSTIISAEHEASDMFTVVYVKAPFYPTPSPSVRGINAQLVGGIIGAVAIVVIVVIVITVFLGCFTYKMWFKQDSHLVIATYESQTPVPSSHHGEVPQGQPHMLPQALPVSQSGGNGSSMQTGGTSNRHLRVLGEEENELYNQKQNGEVHSTTTLTLDYDNKKFSSVGPEAILSGSSSLATVSSNIDMVTKAVYVNGPIATAAADSDIGSEDSRINSDKEPLLEN